jgi:serine phosphatase RsbU (regulator of sigma subunit)
MGRNTLTHILIAEDNPTHLQMVSKILTDRQFKVDLTDRGNMALALAQYSPTDVVILGTNLPDINASAVCRILKANPDTTHIPVIFMASTPERIDKQKLYDAGASDFIEEPIYPAELLARVTLHLELSQLRRQIKAQTAQMSGLSTRWQSELAMAHKIQQGLLPSSTPHWPGLDMVCYTHSAREVGGDFYTYHNFDTRLKLNEKRFAVAVGDVSGKGMPAALLMAISLASFQNLVAKSFSLNKLVTDMATAAYPLNQFLRELDKDIAFYTHTTGQNCALVYAEITKPAAPRQPISLRTVNAGCVSPLLRRASSGAVEWVEVGGMPLGAGLGADFGYPEQAVKLAAKDVVVLMSDGVIEAKNSRGHMLGFEHIEEIVKSAPALDAALIQEHIQGEVMDFVGNAELSDDLTLAVIQV